MQLFTYGIRKIIVRLVMVVFFAFSVRVVLMKSTEDEGISTTDPARASDRVPYRSFFKFLVVRVTPWTVCVAFGVLFGACES